MLITKENFQDNIKDFYNKNKRTFPWRETIDPYRIFVSEVMLQQTQTSRVSEKYLQFVDTFSSVTLLAAASFAEVLSLWSGLGYNRRAKYLHESAKIIVEKYNCQFPQVISELDALPGIGANTAAAVIVYAWNIPIPYIETNIRRVYIHHFFQDKEEVSDEEILPLVQSTMDTTNPREWYWALMDYGSYLSKLTTNPNRKSKHYSKQAKFEGSMRQVRGSILKVLLKSKTLTENNLRNLVQGNPEYFDPALKSLISERLVLKKGDLLSIQ